MMSGPPLWCVRHDGNLWRYSEGAWVEWDGEDGFGHELVQPIRAFQPRLNPVCPVCGEDEAEVGHEAFIGQMWDDSFARQHSGHRIYAKCRRCLYSWYIDPLSKPWEEGGDVQ